MTLGLVDTLILGGKTTQIASNIGTNLIISTITTTTTAIINVLDYLTTSTYYKTNGISELITNIQEMDLEFTIVVIEQVIREQNDKQLPESIKRALLGLNDILTQIHIELNTIKESIENHTKKYFNNWRYFQCNITTITIRKHYEILKSRHTILFDLLKIYNNNI